MYAIRGAIRVERNDRAEIYHGTQQLLSEILRRNDLTREDLVSAFFTMTPDLNADFPAYAAREMGWIDIPMLGAQETAVPGALDRMVRVLLHVRGEGRARHVYLGEAAAMRPDLAEEHDPAAESPGGSTGGPAPTPPRQGPLLVVGLGLIGGSVALAARRSGLFATVCGYDIDPRAVELARRSGAVDEPHAGASLAELLADASVVLLAMPVGSCLAWLERFGPDLAPGTVVVDVASTKQQILSRLDSLPEQVEAIGAHPMAGSELGGMGSARPDLFFGSVWALVRSRRTGPRAEKAAADLLEAVGGEALWIDAGSHDRLTARTSHLPYLVSAALARHVATAGSAEQARRLSGPGLRDMLRLAGSRPGVMTDVLRTNWSNVRAEATAFVRAVEELVTELEAALGAGGRQGSPAGGQGGSLEGPPTEALRLLSEISACRDRLRPDPPSR